MRRLRCCRAEGGRSFGCMRRGYAVGWHRAASLAFEDGSGCGHEDTRRGKPRSRVGVRADGDAAARARAACFKNMAGHATDDRNKIVLND